MKKGHLMWRSSKMRVSLTIIINLKKTVIVNIMHCSMRWNDVQITRIKPT